MEMFVEECDDPGRRRFRGRVFSLSDNDRGSRVTADRGKRRQQSHREGSLTKVNVALQQRIVSEQRKVGRWLWVAHEELVFGSDQQHGEGRVGPIRPDTIADEAIESKRLG